MVHLRPRYYSMADYTPKSLIRNVLRDPTVPVVTARSPRASKLKTPLVAQRQENETNTEQKKMNYNAKAAPPSARGTDPRNLIRAVAKKVFFSLINYERKFAKLFYIYKTRSPRPFPLSLHLREFMASDKRHKKVIIYFEIRHL